MMFELGKDIILQRKVKMKPRRVHKGFQSLKQCTAKKVQTDTLELLNVKKTDKVLSPHCEVKYEKDPNQIVHICLETKKMGSSYSIGGVADVSYQLSKEFIKEGIDSRLIVPYYSAWLDNNDNEGIVIKDKNGNFRREKDAQNYSLKDGESFVILDKNGKSTIELERMDGICGKIEQMNPYTYQKENIVYQVFKINNQSEEINNGLPVYIIHTPNVARMQEAYYNNKKDLSKGHFLEYEYAAFAVAATRALKQIASMTNENFNPANYLLHDRYTFNAIDEMKRTSDDFFEGIKIHEVLHNIGKAYQGEFMLPLDAFSIISTGDNEAIGAYIDSNNGDNIKAAQILREEINERKKKFYCEKKQELNIVKYLSKENILNPFKVVMNFYMGKYMLNDEYNMTEIGLPAARENPQMVSIGNVSTYYGYEVKQSKTRDIACNLYDSIRRTTMVDITNGTDLNSMETAKPFQANGTKFGPKGSFIMSEESPLKNYSPYNVTMSDIEIYKCKQHNKMLFYACLKGKENKEKFDIGEDSLNRLFFTKEQIENKDCPSSVYGYIRNGIENPVIISGWGRGDEQKGFTATLEGFKQFLNDKTIQEIDKRRVILTLGGTFKDKSNPEWKKIKELIDEINKIDNGKYSGQIIFADGWFANKLACCSDFTIFTSRQEPCGITPLESMGCATPVLAIKTGGFPNTIQENETGFFTHNPYTLSKENLNLKYRKTKKYAGKLIRGNIDMMRQFAAGEEVAILFKKAVSLNPSDLKRMQRKCLEAKNNWSDNIKANILPQNPQKITKSAVKRYLEDVFELKKNPKTGKWEEIQSRKDKNLRFQIDTQKRKNALKFLPINFKAFFANNKYFFKHSKVVD